MVKTVGCGSTMRGFESRRSPNLFFLTILLFGVPTPNKGIVGLKKFSELGEEHSF